MLATLISAQSSSSLANQAASSLISAINPGGDGLSLSQVDNALGVSASSAEGQSVAQAFAKLDTNGDGELSQSELASAIQAQQQQAQASTTQDVSSHHHHHHHHHGGEQQAANSVQSTTSSTLGASSSSTTAGATTASSAAASTTTTTTPSASS